MKYFICLISFFLFQITFGQYFKVEYLIKSSDTISKDQIDYNFDAHYLLTISDDESITEYFEPPKLIKQRLKLLRQGKSVRIRQPFGIESRYNNIKDSMSLWTFREYLVNEPLKNWKWTITSEKKKILGFNVVKAISYENEAYTVAWFSPEHKTNLGPGSLW